MAAIDKAKFKEGCEAGGGSYVENADGSFQCNTKSGATIKCPNTTSQCTYTARISRDTSIVVKLTRAGLQQLIDMSSKKSSRPAQGGRATRR
jgi:hypothetical protein